MTRRAALVVLAAVVVAGAGVWFGARAILQHGQPGPTGPAFGYNDRWPTLGIGSGDNNPFQLVADDGANVIRFVVNWGIAQKYDESGRMGPVAFPRGYTNAYNEAVERGIHPILIVAGAPINPRPGAPGAQRAVGMTCRHAAGVKQPVPIVSDNPYALARWKAFVRSVADAFPEAMGIEVWNEENSPGWWGGCKPAENGSRGPGADRYVPHYLHVLKSAYDGIKQSRNPELPIVLGSTATRGGDPNKLDWATFLSQLLIRAEADYGSHLVDAVGLHPYRNSQDPGTGPTISDRLASSAVTQVEEARRILDRQGAGDLPIWATEVAASTSAPSHSLFAGASARAPTEQLQVDQARALDAIYVALRDAGVPVIVVHSFTDQLDRPGWQYGAGVTVPTHTGVPGVLGYPYRRKCAYYTLGSERGAQSVPSACQR